MSPATAAEPGTRRLGTKRQATRLVGIDHRTFDRYVGLGKINKYVDGLGRERYDLDELRALSRFRPAPPGQPEPNPQHRPM